MRAARYGAAVGDPAPGPAGGGQPHHDHPPGPGEAALPQPGSAVGHRRTLDREVRTPAPARAERHQAPGRGGHHGRTTGVRLRHIHQEHPGAGVGRAHRRGADRRVLGAQQRLRLAARLAVGASPCRRLGHRRPGRHRAGVRTTAAAGDDVRPSGRGTAAGALPGDLRHRAVSRDRPAHRHAREPGRRQRTGGRFGRLAGCARQPQVAAGDRPRAAAGALGDARRPARQANGPQRRGGPARIRSPQLGHVSWPSRLWRTGRWKRRSRCRLPSARRARAVRAAGRG